MHRVHAKTRRIDGKHSTHEGNQAENERRILTRFLGLIGATTELRSLIDVAIAFFCEESGCEAVGVRLQEGDDFPYYETSGFPPEFVLAESALCGRRPCAQLERDSTGNPVLACMCGKVIRGQINENESFFTEGGSFWTNSTTQWLATINGAGCPPRMRDHCSKDYQSLALIALRDGGRRVGLLQLNDRRSGRFTAELIAFWERLGSHLVGAIAMVQADDSLCASDEHYRLVAETMSQGVVYHDRHGRMIAMNPAAERILGKTPQQFLGSTPDREQHHTIREDGSLFPGSEHPCMVALRTGKEVHVVTMGVFNPQRNERRWIRINAVPVFRRGETQPSEVYTIFEDVTERKRAEEQLKRVSRAKEALASSAKALVRASDEKAYLEEVCRIIVERCGYRMAWISYAENDKAKSIHPMACAGVEQGYLDTLNLTWANTWRGRGPGGTAIRTGRVCQCRDMRTDAQFKPWREEALKRGFASSAVFPLRACDRAFGELTVYLDKPAELSEEELEMMTELANDCAHGVFTLRLRAEKAQAEETLHRSQEQFRAAFDNGAVGMALTSTEGALLKVNPAFCRMLGFSQAEMVGHSFTEFTHPADLEKNFAGWQRAACGEAETFRMEKRFICKDGSIVWGDMSTALVRDGQGAPLHLVTHVQDITVRKNADEALRASEERFVKTFAMNPSAIALTRLSDASIIDVNQAWLTGTGYTREEVVGRQITKLRFWRTQDNRRREIERIRKEGSYRGRELTLLKKSGEPFTVLAAAEIVKIDGDEGLLLTWLDITERKHAEKALADANEKLLATTKTLEVRNDQLTTLSEQLERRVVDRTSQLRALAGELTQSEERERRRIAKILHDDLQQLLVAARMRLRIAQKPKGSEEQRKILQDAEQLITDAIGSARNLSRDMSLVVLHEQGLSAAMGWIAQWMEQNHGLKVRIQSGAMTDLADGSISVALFQSVRELLFNVTKHAGVKVANVRMSRKGDNEIEIVVSDKGKGFDPAQAAACAAKGAGLGLFSIRERLELLGGRMEVESAPGRGCRFRLLAPLNKNEKSDLRGMPEPRLPALPGKSRPPVEGDAQTGQTRIRVVLADDHKIIRDALANLLSQQTGLEIVGLASDGQEAVEKAHKLQPDVLITDVSMPRMDGIQVAGRVSKSWPHIAIIGITMHADRFHHEAMRKAGAATCLVKTGSIEELVQAIFAAVRSSPTRALCP